MTASKRYGTTSTTVAHPTAVQLLVDLVDASGMFFLSLSGVGVVVPFISPLLRAPPADAAQHCDSAEARTGSRYVMLTRSSQGLR